MKFLPLILSFLSACAGSAFGQLVYEPFNYADGQLLTTANANWTLNGSPDDTMVAPGNLSLSGLAPSLGNSITNGGAGAAVRIALSPSITAGTVYYSFGLRIDELGGTFTSTTSFIGAFVNSVASPATYGARLQIKAATGGYQLGIGKAGSGTQFDPTIYNAGQTLFIVGSYTFDPANNDVARLWINPASSSFGGTEPAETISDNASGTDLALIDRFTFRQNTAANTPAAMTFDELRVGSTWADVTPVPEPSLMALVGLAALALLSRFFSARR